MVLSSVSIALAAPFDLSHRTGTANYSFNQFVDSPSIFDEVADDMENFLIEAVDGSFYNVKDVNDRLEAGAADFAEAIEGLQPVQPGEEDDLEVVSVSAINSTQVEVKFNKAVKEVKPANFKVTDKDGNLVFVSQVTLNEAKDVATLTFVNKFADKATYTVEISNIADVDGNVMEKTTEAFTYVAAEVTKVEFTQTTVAPGTDLKTVVKVTDALGRDVTKEVNIEFESSNTTLIPEKGIVGTLPQGKAADSAIVVAKVKVGDNKWVKSARTTIKVADKTPTTFVGFNIYAGAANPALTTDAFLKLDADEKADFVYVNDYDEDKKPTKQLSLYYKDQYGNSMAAVPNEDVAITNLTPNIVIVEKDNTNNKLKIKPVFPGEGYVKVKVGEVENTIKIVVREESKITTIELDKTNISVVEGITDTVKITFKDQFGTKKDATPEAKSSASTIATAQGVENGVSITGVKEGTATVEVSYKVDANTTLKQTINVTVTKAADLAGYKVEVPTTELDLTPDSDNAAKDAVSEVEVKLFELDTNGNKIRTVTIDGTNAKLVLVDEDGNELTDDDEKIVEADTKDTIKAQNVGTGYVQVVVGTLVVDTLEFTVIDTDSIPTTVEFTRNDLAYVADYDDNAFSFKLVGSDKEYNHSKLENDLETIIKVKDQYGKDMENVTLTIDPLFTNLNGLELKDGALDSVTKATATLDIVVKEIKVGDGDNLISEPVVIKVVVDIDALDAVNDYLTKETYVYAEAPEALEGYLSILGLDVGPESDYAKLETDEHNRKTAVFYDLYNNKPEQEGYDLATLTTYFNDMVATRLVTQASMDLVNNAKTIEELNGISFVTMLLERFQKVSYQTHSDIPVTEKITTLGDLVTRYNALGEAGQKAVLAKIIEKRPEGGYARSQATTDALDGALTEVETGNCVVNITLCKSYDTIQAAIDAATNGDTILIASGVYDEIVRVTGKSVTLLGMDQEGTKIKAISAYPGEENYLIIKNLTVYGNNASGQSYAGIFISNGNVTIESCIIEPADGSDASKYGIETQYNNAADITVKNCKISGYKGCYFNPTTGILKLLNNDFNGVGPSVDTVNKTTITGNTNMAIGLFIGYGFLDKEPENVLNELDSEFLDFVIALHMDNPGAIVKLSTNSATTPSTWGGFFTAVVDGELIITEKY